MLGTQFAHKLNVLQYLRKPAHALCAHSEQALHCIQLSLDLECEIKSQQYKQAIIISFAALLGFWWLSSNSLPSNRFLRFGWLVSRLQSWAMVLTFAALAFGLIYRSRSLEISRALCDNTPSVVDCCKSNSVSSSAVAASASGLWWSAYSARALYKKQVLIYYTMSVVETLSLLYKICINACMCNRYKYAYT